MNIFAANESGDEKPDSGLGIRRGGTMADGQEGYRERVGFVPGWLGNIKAPTM